MDTVTMRTAITQAWQHEQRTRELAQLLNSRLYQLHHSVQTGDDEPVDMLLDFVDRFVRRTPDILDGIGDLTRNSAYDELGEALLGACAEFFVAPPALLHGRNGLNGAMCKAFLCQRLIEDINDSCLLRNGAQLAPIDITRANLVIHHLVGEPFANLLEDRVRDLCQALQRFIPRTRAALAPARERWSQFSDDFSYPFFAGTALGTPSVH